MNPNTTARSERNRDIEGVAGDGGPVAPSAFSHSKTVEDPSRLATRTAQANAGPRARAARSPLARVTDTTRHDVADNPVVATLGAATVGAALMVLVRHVTGSRPII